MTTYSQSDLATRVLKDLGIYAPDETPSADDLQDTIEIISSEASGMATRGIPIAGGSDQAVPQEYLSALSRRLGLSAAPAFGVMSLADAVVAIPAAEQYIRQLSARPPTGEVAEHEYF